MLVGEQPSFIEGMARAIDIGDSMTNYNYSPNGDEADHAAIWAVWALIAGGDCIFQFRDFVAYFVLITGPPDAEYYCDYRSRDSQFIKVCQVVFQLYQRPGIK